MKYLKQSTAVTLKLGPFLDETDGVSPETGLTLTQADVRLSKNGAAFAQKNQASACTHDENGWYACALDATDTAALGRLLLAVSESGALPVWHEFTVLPANAYDALVAGADRLAVDALEVSGSSAAADSLEANIAYLDAAISGLNDLSPAEVNAQLLDVLSGDTFAEPASVPAATASLVDKIGFIFAFLRNKKTQSATTLTLRNDADDAVIGAASVSDDGDTFTQAEMS